MRRILFRAFGRPVYSYAAMLYVGIVLGIYAQLYAGRQAGLESGRLLACTLILLVVALAGARLLFVVCHWNRFREDWTAVLRVERGGAAMYGGLVTAVPLSPLVTGIFGVPAGTFWDTATFTMVIGMIVTRAGCLLNGCCAGRPSHRWFAVNLPDDRGVWTRRVPNQLFEAAWGLIVLVAATQVWAAGLFAGAVMLSAIGTYGLGRLLMEGLRDVQARVGGVAVNQAISVVLMTIAVAGFSAAWWWR